MVLYQTYQMTDFTLFNKALEKYNKNIIEQEDEFSHNKITALCEHENLITEKGVSVCMDCGEEVQLKISTNKEWRYYGNVDTKHSTDPNRVQIRKNEERTIFKDVENLGFSESIVAKANMFYAQVTKGKIYRGNSRKAIVFACIFHAYKTSGKPQSHDRLIKIFNLSRKIGLKGLKQVNLCAPKDSKIRTTYITPINLVDEIMEQFSATKDQKQEVIDIYNSLKEKSSTINNNKTHLNRSRPQSVASGVVYYWICLKKKEISLKDFAQKVSLSELTVNKIAKAIAEVLETPNII